MKRILKTIIAVILVGTFAFTFRLPLEKQIEGLLTRARSFYAPCGKPINYTIGSFDTKFGISKENFLSSLKEAENIWEKPRGKDLFAYASDGKLAVNLVYDYRQEATNKLKNLGFSVEENRNSYDLLKIRYAELEARYKEAKAIYDSRVAVFEKRKEAYDQEVKYWNTKGGAPKREYARLQEEGIALEAELNEIKGFQANVNEYVSQTNAFGVVLNRLASSLNLDVGKYNDITTSRGEEFTEGDYRISGGKEEINIYEFSNRAKLVRVLAHEFGHALGLEHVDDQKAIMYKLNTSKNEVLTVADISELKAKCTIK